MRWLAVTIGYATIKWLTNGSQLHHLRLEIQGLEVGGVIMVIKVKVERQ